MSPRFLRRLAPLALAFFASCSAHAQSPEAADAVNGADPSFARQASAAAHVRWHRELDAFRTADREHPSADNGIVFVGSSTLRLWTHLARDFPQQPTVLNRGFGGSTLADCALLTDALVTRYKPRQVVVYAGDNDIAEGRTPLQVLHSFARFAIAVRAASPQTHITFISIKPSPSREPLVPQMREANHMVAAYLRTLANSDYVDVFTPMLGADGRPRRELFRADELHMNDRGYALWQGLIASHLLAPAVLPAPPES